MRRFLQQLVAVAGRHEPEEVLDVDRAAVRGRAHRDEILVDPLQQRLVALQLEVRLPEVERADVADGHQRVAARLFRVREDARVQVQVVVGLRLVDVTGAAARDPLELDQLDAHLRGERLRRDVELLRGERREAALVVGDGLHAPPSSASSSDAPGRYGCGNEPSPYGSRPASPLCSNSRRSSACSPWTIPRAPVAVLLLHEVVERARLVHVLRDMRRERRRHLPVLGQAHRELHFLQRLEHALRLRDELGLAQPAGRLRRGDEPLRVLRAHVRVDALLHRLGAELRDRVPWVDALRAALLAEVAAGAIPDPVRVRVRPGAAPPSTRRGRRRRSACPSRARPARGTPGRTPSSCTRRRSSRT